MPKLKPLLAGLVILGVLVFLVIALSAMHKYDLGMYQHNARVFLRGGNLYADPRNFTPPPAIIPLTPLAWMGNGVKLFQVVFTLGTIFAAILFFTRLWGGRERAPLLFAAIILSFPFIDTMSQGHLGGWTLLGYTLAFVTLTTKNAWQQALIGAIAFSLVLIKPQGGLFVALALLAVSPWLTRLVMVTVYALQWLWVTAATGGVATVTVAWLVQLTGHAAKYPNLPHDVSPKSIIRNFIGPEWQYLAYGVSALVAALWLALAWLYFKRLISGQTLLMVSIPLGYWFSPYFSNYDLLPIFAVLFVWLVARYPKWALAFYVLHLVHWISFMAQDYGPGIVQAAPGWIVFMLVAGGLKIAADLNAPTPPASPQRG